MALPKSKLKDKDTRKTLEGIVNESVMRTLFNLEAKGYIDEINEVLKEGKESIILSGKNREGKKIIIKVFKIEASQFKNFYKYIIGDMRFRGVKKNKRSIVYAWCRKEFSNLRRVRKHGVKVPEVYAYMNNVIVMEFIGNETIAPQLREYEFKNEREMKSIFEKIIKSVRLYVSKAKLVHADLSPFNILVHNSEPYFIDWGQSVVLEHPNALEFLERDLNNIISFFEKNGLNINKDKTINDILKLVEE